jgi:tetratricopeptide (TPR) repeat protein
MRMTKHIVCSVAAAALFCVSAGRMAAQEMPAMPGMGAHHHHDDASTEKLGTVHFPVSCAASQQAPFERGIALLHSFGYTEAQEQFRAIAKADPTCAMAHWGIAMSQFHELWGRPEASAVKTGADEMAAANNLIAGGAKVTPREQMYIAALTAFYAEDLANYQSAADAYTAKMKALHEAYPGDVEAAAFYALAELASVAPGDTSLTHERMALAVLVPLFKANPEHPGLAHYIIHTCDTPKLAQQGLDAAQVYAKIAPSSPHALHMPGHIFARLGMWPQDIQSNLASVAASERAAAAGEPGVAHQMHADEFLVYAYLQVGEDAKAKDIAGQMPALAKQMAAMQGMDDMKNAGPFFVNELNAIVPMEMHDWKTLVSLKPVEGSPVSATFDTYWGQGTGAGHLRDANTTAAALTNFESAIEALKKTPYAFMVEPEQVQKNEIVAWDAYARGDNDAAVNSMRAAADQQDKLGQYEVDIPAREMLGDLLLLLHRPQDALSEYLIALQLSPNRLNGLLSAGAAAEAANQPQMATRFYEQAVRNTHDSATSNRPELLHAVAFVQQHPAGHRKQAE